MENLIGNFFCRVLRFLRAVFFVYLKTLVAVEEAKTSEQWEISRNIEMMVSSRKFDKLTKKDKKKAVDLGIYNGKTFKEVIYGMKNKEITSN